MILLAQLIGVFVIAIGLAMVLRPQMLKGLIAFWAKEKQIYAAGIIRIMFGLIILLAAPQARWFWVVTIVGLLVLTKGILTMIMKPGTIKSILKWWSEQPTLIVRALAAVAMAFGMLLIYAI